MKWGYSFWYWKNNIKLTFITIRNTWSHAWLLNLKDIGTKTHNLRSRSAPNWPQNYLNLNFKNHKNRTGSFLTIEIERSCLLEQGSREGVSSLHLLMKWAYLLYIRQKNVINGSWSAQISHQNYLYFTFITFINRIGSFWLLKLKDHVWFMGE